MNELNEIGKDFNVFDKQSKEFVDNHKHLANTLIEIPMETIGQWNRDAQKYSMEHYNRVESAVVELYMKLKTDTFRIIERNKNSQAELVAGYTKIISERQDIIEKKEDQYQACKRENERLLLKIQNLNAPK